MSECMVDFAACKLSLMLCFPSTGVHNDRYEDMLLACLL